MTSRLLVLVAALALAGCGGSSEEAQPPPPPPPPPPPSTTTRPAGAQAGARTDAAYTLTLRSAAEDEFGEDAPWWDDVKSIHVDHGAAEITTKINAHDGAGAAWEICHDFLELLPQAGLGHVRRVDVFDRDEQPLSYCTR